MSTSTGRGAETRVSTGPSADAVRSGAGAAEAVRESEERLRAILQTAVEGIITIDERGIMESVNPSAEAMFGYAASELVGRNVTLLMPSPYREGHDDYIRAYLRTGQARIIGIGREAVGQRKDGTVFPMELAVSEVKLGTRRLFTGFVRDITERKRLEAEVLEISDREQRRIGQDLHDGLGQHLAGLELMCQALEQRLEGTRGREAREAAVRVADLGRYVREAIQQTRLLARGLSPVLLESEGLMAALGQLARNTSEISGIDCRFECDPPVLIADHGVATHLYRIAQEALSNAIKHGKANSIRLSLLGAEGRARLLVCDDGCGFPDPLPPGKGMGLRIMRYRAGMIGGSIAIQGRPEGGTSVLCSFRPRP